MTPRTFGIVATLTVISIVAATVAVSREKGFTTENKGDIVFPELEKKINDVAKVEIRLNERTMTMELKDNIWRMLESGGYAIQPKVIKHAILGFSGLRFVEAKTRQKDLYLKLDLRSPDEEGSKGREVRVYGKDGSKLVDVVLGRTRYNMPGTTRDGVYFRKANDPQTWLGIGQLDINREPSDWLKTEIINIDARRMKSARITHPDGETYLVSKPEPTGKSFAMADIPDGKMLKLERDPNIIATVLEDIELDNVTKTDPAKFTSDNIITAEYATFDGLIINIQMAETGEMKAGKPDYWVTFTARADTDSKNIVDEVTQINAKTSPWMYRLPGYKSARLNKRLADMLKDRPAGS